MTLREKLYDTKEKITIALDGPAGSGKGLISSKLSKLFSLDYIQSSLLYRAVAFICINNKIVPQEIDKVINISADTQPLSEVIKNNDLSNELIAAVASKTSTIKEVRDNLNSYLLTLISTTARSVIEGRDIGTVVAPNADLKIFLTADLSVRAERRYKQLLMSGKSCILSEVLEQLRARDIRDKERKHGPLEPAKDAFILDSSSLNPDQVVDAIKDFVNKN